jgi:Tfp pilus assembly protein PilX
MTPRGFALLPALFLIVVVAMLAAFAVRIGGTQRQTADYALLGERAQAAANAGIEWGRQRALRNASCLPGPSVIALNQGALRGYTVQVRCTSTLHTDCPAPPAPVGGYPVYEITAIGQWRAFGAPDYTSRTVRKTFTNAPC